MIFPRNAGFGRCYLVSTRHEIPYNIDRNLTGTRLRLRKNRNKINPATVRIPIPVLLLSFEPQTIVFRLFDSHLRKFKKFIIKKFYFHNQPTIFLRFCGFGWFFSSVLRFLIYPNAPLSLEFSILDAFYGLKKVRFFHCSPPHSFQSDKYRLTWDGKCEKFSVLFSLTQPRGGTPDFKWQG